MLAQPYLSMNEREKISEKTRLSFLPFCLPVSVFSFASGALSTSFTAAARMQKKNTKHHHQQQRLVTGGT